MALIHCPECAKSVSDKSSSCPHCGYPIASPNPTQVSQNTKVNSNHQRKANSGCSGTFLVIIGIIGLTVFSFVRFSYKNYVERVDSYESTSSSTTQEIDIETTAEKMINTYEENEVRGDAIYKDKTIKVVGIVDDITSDFSDEAVVLLSSGKDRYNFNNIHASGDTNFHNHAINLKKGDQITLVCVGGGEAIGSPLLRDCRF